MKKSKQLGRKQLRVRILGDIVFATHKGEDFDSYTGRELQHGKRPTSQRRRRQRRHSIGG